ncbi:MAG: flagellar hook-associated protein FlgK [Dehalococcoidia bacterium]
MGLGVDSSRIRRLRDELLDVQYRHARTGLEEYDARASALRQAEVVFNEPSDQGLQALMTRFFNGFRDLAAQPESMAARSAAVEQAATLTAAFRRSATALTSQRADLDASLDTKVSEINSTAKEIADLNAQVRLVTVSGGTANDLFDRRDLLLDKLSGLVGVTVQAGTNGTVDVLLGTRKLVDNITANQLATQADAGNNNLKKIVWQSDAADASITGGVLRGIIDARDTNLTGLLTSLNELASTLITAVNGHHAAGYGLNNATGLNLFTGSTAADIDVNPAIRSNLQNLATSAAPGEPGNPDVARAIAGVQDELLLAGNTATIDDTYRGVVARLGVASQQYNLLADNQKVVTEHIDAGRQSVAGVSLDEEAAELVKSQHAYQASAKVISVIDELLDTLVNRTV